MPFSEEEKRQIIAEKKARIAGGTKRWSDLIQEIFPVVCRINQNGQI
ncbi:hypothetical protein J2T17_007463 [Paenibacillus mucilaginosus]